MSYGKIAVLIAGLVMLTPIQANAEKSDLQSINEQVFVEQMDMLAAANKLNIANPGKIANGFAKKVCQTLDEDGIDTGFTKVSKMLSNLRQKNQKAEEFLEIAAEKGSKIHCKNHSEELSIRFAARSTFKNLMK
jgi:hypothetical protein